MNFDNWFLKRMSLGAKVRQWCPGAKPW